MADETRANPYRIPPPTAFLPMTDDHPNVTPRTHRLSLLHTRSSGMLFDLPRVSSRVKLPSLAQHNEDDERGPWNERDPSPSALRRQTTVTLRGDQDLGRRISIAPEALYTPHMRSMRLIGNSNPRYHWHKYYKSDSDLAAMRKPIRKYYERNNFLVAQYIYIDRLLDSSLPHDLMREYETTFIELASVPEENTPTNNTSTEGRDFASNKLAVETKLKRTPKALYRLPTETSPLMTPDEEDPEDGPYPEIKYEENEDEETGSRVVIVAIYVNMVANILLLIGKIIVTILTSSLSVLASLVDAALDFLSTAIVWTTTLLISRQDHYAYPIGRRRLEPVGVLVFSVVMITSFFQVALTCLQRLMGDDHEVVELTLPAIIIMLSTVLIKGFCWFWCRLVKNSSVQALAQDAVTDVIFNIFSIIFPLVGFYANIWWLDPLGGFCLSFFVIFNWSRSASEHVRNLCGAAASADERNVLLYLTMRFAKTIKYIQNLQAYHAGDKLNLEVDIVLDENTNLKDSHDLSESLQYVLESVPTVDRAFVHADYKRTNLPSHMNQQGE